MADSQIKDQKFSSLVVYVLHLQDGNLLLNIHMRPVPSLNSTSSPPLVLNLTLALVSLTPFARTGTMTLAHLSCLLLIGETVRKVLALKTCCGRERPSLQEVHFVTPMRFRRVGNASADGGGLDVAVFKNFSVAHGVFAEVDGLDRATRLDEKTTYCSSSQPNYRLLCHVWNLPKKFKNSKIQQLKRKILV